VGANLRLALESPLLVQARRITLGDRTPVAWDTGKRAARSGRPLGLLSMNVGSLSLSVSCAGVNSWVVQNLVPRDTGYAFGGHCDPGAVALEVQCTVHLQCLRTLGTRD
jgi:hypothetical protein